MQAIAFGAGVMILMMASIFIVGSAALLRDRDKDGFIGMGFGLAFVWYRDAFPLLWPDSVPRLGKFMYGAYSNRTAQRVNGHVLVCARDEQEAVEKMKSVLEAEGLPFVRVQNR